jgi:hypothetical protein
MNTFNTILVNESQARHLYREYIGPDEGYSSNDLEVFFNRIFDDKPFKVKFTETENNDLIVIRGRLREYLQRPNTETPPNIFDENILLRQILALRVSGCSQLYTDDGELQDNSERPFIDYKRDSATDIQRKLQERAAAKLARENPDFKLPKD